MKKYLQLVLPAFLLAMIMMSLARSTITCVKSLTVHLSGQAQGDKVNLTVTVPIGGGGIGHCSVIHEISLMKEWTDLHYRTTRWIKDRVSIFNKETFAYFDVRISKIITGVLRASQAIEGKNGWLFYRSLPALDGDTTADYVGRERYDLHFMKETLDAVTELDNKLKSMGISLCLLVVPNKENVYSEFMPDKVFRASNISRTDLLIKYIMSHSNIMTAYCKEALLHYKKDFLLYYPLDSHWNMVGGYVGAQCVFETMGFPVEPLGRRRISLCDADHRNDIVSIIKAPDLYEQYSESEITITGLPNVGKKTNWMEYSHNQNFSAPEDKSILVVGDSFMHALIPSFLERFTHVHDVHRSECASLQEFIDISSPKMIVLEFVERYVEEIQPTAQRLAASLKM